MKVSFLTFCFGTIFGLVGGYALFTYVEQHTGQNSVQWRFSDAASRGSLPEVQALHAQGAKLDFIPTYANGAVSGFPALFLAAAGGHADVVEWLLQHGANPNWQVSDSTPYGMALSHQKQANKTVELLKAHGAKLP